MTEDRGRPVDAAFDRDLTHDRLESVQDRLDTLDSNLRWASRLRTGLAGVTGLLAILVLVLDAPLMEHGAIWVLTPILIGMAVLFAGSGLLARRWGRDVRELEERQAHLVGVLGAHSDQESR